MLNKRQNVEQKIKLAEKIGHFDANSLKNVQNERLRKIVLGKTTVRLIDCFLGFQKYPGGWGMRGPQPCYKPCVPQVIKRKTEPT